MSHPPNRVPIRCGGVWRSVPAVACIAWPCTIVHSPFHGKCILYTWAFDLGTIDCVFFFLKKSEELPLIALSLPRTRNSLGTKCRGREMCIVGGSDCAASQGKQYAELWPALPASGSNTMGGELASDNSCDRHEWSSIGHGLRSTPTSVASLHVTLFHSDVAWKRKGEDLQT